MNNEVRIIKTESYYRFVFDEDNMRLLAKFLTDDVGPGVFRWKQWLLDDADDQADANYACLLKRDNKIIIIYMHSGDGEPWIEVTSEQFIQILDGWQKFRETQDSKEFIITKNEDDSFDFQIVT